MRPVLFEVAGVPVYGYGVMQLAAYVMFAVLVAVGIRRFRPSASDLGLVLGAAAIGSVLGAKGGFVVLNLGAAPLSRLVFSSGFFMSGAIVGAAIVVAITAYLRPVFAAVDALFAALVGYWIVSNVGCLLAGCCVGAPSSLPWAMHFPGADERSGLYGLARHPLPLYSMAVEFAVLGWMLAAPIRRAGVPTLVAASVLFLFRGVVDTTLADPIRLLSRALLVLALVSAAAAFVVHRRSAATPA